MSTVAVIGTGYVGLTTGACFSHLGHRVICADVVAEKVERLSRGDVPILEAGLPEIVKAGLAGGRLSFVLGAAAAVADCEFVYLCVPTPQSDDGSADLSYIRAAAAEIGPRLSPGTVVVNKSTVPVGSTRVVEEVLGRDDVSVVSNPEFLREGSAVHDFLHPDRVVVGSDDQAAATRVASLYESLGAPVVVTDPASAETIKYASNAYLATKISFVNAVANVCEAVGADVRDVLLGMGYDRRIGFEFMKPGPGFGGSCFLGDETLLVRRGGHTRLLSLADLFAEIKRTTPDGWEALSWRSGEPTPEFLPVALFTKRDYVGGTITVRTKMGRRITVTEDHPFVVGDGRSDGVTRRLANQLTTSDWLPVAQRCALAAEPPELIRVSDTVASAGLAEKDVIVWLSEAQRDLFEERASGLPTPRRYEVRRCQAMRLDELRSLGLTEEGGSLGTASNGTSVPATIPVDEELWRVVGLYLAEGWMTRDKSRARIYWAFHPRDEADLVEVIVGYCRKLGVKVTSRPAATAHHVSVSSRLLAAVFKDGLGLGTNCYDKRLPDAIWAAPAAHKRAILRGLWDGDGSWSYVAGGPSVVLEYGTVSRQLADGMLRLLGDLGIVARLKVGRTAKSTCDTYWLSISGADQVEENLWLLPAIEGWEIAESLSEQAKRIAPTGHRRLSKNATWVRVTGIESTSYQGPVYSLKVPGSGTVVATHGLVVGQCFPKDTNALIRIAEDAGYDFGLLRGVNQVNTEQFERVTAKIVAMAGGSVEGLTVAAWGLTFKARTDDLRMSPALEVVRRLLERGARVRAFDPAVESALEGPGLEAVEVCADPYGACEGAAVLAVLTEWDEFRRLDFAKVASLLAAPLVVDARNLLDPAAMRRRGFVYEGIGR
ncbi:MAG: nucleotide sugar dehydrogenase [Acidimicrobiales bacterium]